MTTNRLAVRSENAPFSVATKGMTKDEREAFWIDRGNRILWGQEATTKGEYLKPRPDLEWHCKDGFYFIMERTAA